MMARRASSTAVTRSQRKHRPDYQIVLYVGLLMLLGLVIMYAIGPQRAEVLNSAYGTDAYTGTYFVIKQAASLALAFAAFFALAFVPLELVKRHAGLAVVAGLGLSGLLFLFGNVLKVEAIAHCAYGACRWIDLGPLGSFQPAELLKFGILIFGARLLASGIAKGRLNDWQNTLMPFLVMIGAALLFVIVFQKDLGTGITIAAIVGSMLMVAGLSTFWMIRLGIGAVILGVLSIVIAPHRISRVMTFFQSNEAEMTSELAGASYHIMHAKIAIGSGGMFGVGIGNSVQATGYLPEAINDSVFAILGETFGFIGLIGLLLLFTLMLMRILKVSERVSDPWMKLVAAGVFGWVASHVILNIASMIGIFPLTGITLPLLSFGGTSMMFIAAAMGLVFAISRYTSHETTTKETANANFVRGRGIGRTRDAGRRRR